MIEKITQSLSQYHIHETLLFFFNYSSFFSFLFLYYCSRTNEKYMQKIEGNL